MLRLRPYNDNDADTILSWPRMKEHFMNGTQVI